MNQNPQRVSSENYISSSCCWKPLIPTSTENTGMAPLRRWHQQAFGGQQLHGGESGSKLKDTQVTICGRSNGPIESEEHETKRQSHISRLDNVHYMLGSLVRRSLVGNKDVSGWIRDCPLKPIPVFRSPLLVAWSKVSSLWPEQQCHLLNDLLALHCPHSNQCDLKKTQIKQTGQ